MTNSPTISLAKRTTEDSSPVPLSFPAILRHPGLSDRYAHLRTTKERSQVAEGSAKASLKKGRRHDNEGKKWVRRKENGLSFYYVTNRELMTKITLRYI
jgi:hypothetical protein